MFKKPKRNFRARRVRNSESEEEQEDGNHARKDSSLGEWTVVSSDQSKGGVIDNVGKTKPKSKDKVGATMLSFGDDEGEYLVQVANIW